MNNNNNIVVVVVASQNEIKITTTINSTAVKAIAITAE